MRTKSVTEAEFANLHMHSDIQPYEIVGKISDKTILVRRMSAEKDPNWKPNIIQGGFSGHCTNQSEQTWLYSSDDQAPVIRARLRKDGYFHSVYGRHVLNTEPLKFYDYNF